MRKSASIYDWPWSGTHDVSSHFGFIWIVLNMIMNTSFIHSLTNYFFVYGIMEKSTIRKTRTKIKLWIRKMLYNINPICGSICKVSVYSRRSHINVYTNPLLAFSVLWKTIRRPLYRISQFQLYLETSRSGYREVVLYLGAQLGLWTHHCSKK